MAGLRLWVLAVFCFASGTELIHYRFWTSTTPNGFYDYSGHDNHASASGDVSESSMGVLLTNSESCPILWLPSNDYVQNNVDFPQQFSLVFWMRPLGSYISLFSYSSSSWDFTIWDDDPLCVNVAGSELCLGTEDTVVNTYSSTVLWTFNEWQLLVVTGDCVNQCNVWLYLNGAMIGSMGFQSSNPYQGNGGMALGIDYDENCSGDLYLYEFILMDEILTLAQIQRYMAMPGSPQCATCDTICALVPSPVCLPTTEVPVPDCGGTCTISNACEALYLSTCFSTSYYEDCMGDCCTCADGNGFTDCTSYWNQDEVCQPCDSTCLTCWVVDGQASASTCSRCWPNAQLSGPAPASCQCISGFYPSPNASKCIVCPGLCATCASATNCLTCRANAAFSGGCHCIDGYYLADSGTSCAKCDAMCATCVSGSGSSCLTCGPGGVLSGLAPTSCTCQPGYVLDPVKHICCSIECTACSLSGQCLGCFQYAQLTAQQTCSCESGYYPSPDSAHCGTCSRLCLTCVDGSSQGCIACHDFAALVRTSPSLCACQSGYFANPDAASCSPCGNMCAECQDATHCTRCTEGAALVGNMCTACPTGCQLCADVSICTVCETGYFRTLSGMCNICETCPGLYAYASGPFANTYNITFTRPVNKTFDRSDFCVRTLPESSFTWTVSSPAPVSITVQGGPWANVTELRIHFLSAVRDEYGFPLLNASVTVPPPVDLPPPAPTLNDSVTTATQATVSVVGGSAVIAGVSGGAGSSALALLSQMQYFSYIGTANYSMTGTMNTFYTSLNQKSLIPNVFRRDLQSDGKVAGRRLDSIAELIDVYDFLDSAGQYITLLVFLMALHGLMYLLNRYLGRKWPCVRRLERSFVWANYLYFWYFAFLDLLISALLQMKNSGRDWSSARAVISNLLAIFTLVATTTTPFAVFAVIYKRQAVLFSDISEPLQAKLSPLVANIRRDLAWAKYLYPVYYLQRVLYSFLIVFLRGRTLLQAFALILPCAFMAVFVLVTRPLLVRAARVLHVVAEIDALLVFVLLCAVTLEYSTPEISLCWVIFFLTAKSFLCTCLIFVLNTIQEVRTACKARKSRLTVAAYTAESLSVEPQKGVITTEPDVSFGGDSMWAKPVALKPTLIPRNTQPTRRTKPSANIPLEANR